MFYNQKYKKEKRNKSTFPVALIIISLHFPLPIQSRFPLPFISLVIMDLTNYIGLQKDDNFPISINIKSISASE